MLVVLTREWNQSSGLGGNISWCKTSMNLRSIHICATASILDSNLSRILFPFPHQQSLEKWADYLSYFVLAASRGHFFTVGSWWHLKVELLRAFRPHANTSKWCFRSILGNTRSNFIMSEVCKLLSIFSVLISKFSEPIWVKHLHATGSGDT